MQLWMNVTTDPNPNPNPRILAKEKPNFELKEAGSVNWISHIDTNEISRNADRDTPFRVNCSFPQTKWSETYITTLILPISDTFETKQNNIPCSPVQFFWPTLYNMHFRYKLSISAQLLANIGTTTVFVTIFLGLVDFWGCSAGVICCAFEL